MPLPSLSLNNFSFFLLSSVTYSCSLSLIHTTTTMSSFPDCLAHIKVYSYYEIDHSKLSIKTSNQLNFIRVVMVTEKSKGYVSVRFPSINAIRAYFSDDDVDNEVTKKKKKLPLAYLPVLDEKFIMGADVASEALYRRILSNEFVLRSNQSSFWINEKLIMTSSSSSSNMDKNGVCWSELEEGLKWGTKRIVRYLNNNNNNNNNNLFNVKVEQQVMMRAIEEEDDDDVEEEDDDVEVDDDVEFKRNNPRPKRANNNNNKQKSMVVYSPQKKKKKTSSDRWSAVRFKLAEESMLKIMKQKGAVFGNPILRLALRSEARKLIGDTGLLDHLLKHMAGKVAPCGELRFMRRHNTQGAMEYWLENADLVQIRKDAGVDDPFWTPPPGWTPGDNPTQDPVCAREIKDLKQDMAKIMRDLQELVRAKKQREEDVIVTPKSFLMSSQNRELDSLLPSIKEAYIELMTKKSKIEEQLLDVSLSLIEMEEGAGMLKSVVNNKNSSLPSLLEPETPLLGSEREIVQNAENTEEKAERIQRLKSGFRICKPQASFLWPNMAISTPPSVSSSSNIPRALALGGSSSIINLNEIPSGNQNEDASVTPITYQRRVHNLFNTATPRAKKVAVRKEISEQEMKRSESWLALANSSLDTK